MSRVPIFGVRVEGCPYIIRPSAYAVVRNEEAALAVVQTPRGYYLLGGGIEGDEIRNTLSSERLGKRRVSS
jgi:hypothetical protein